MHIFVDHNLKLDDIANHRMHGYPGVLVGDVSIVGMVAGNC